MDNPPDFFSQKWYAVPDDTIGGWAIANVDKPTSGHDHRQGDYQIGDFLTEEIARYVAASHNYAISEGEYVYRVIREDGSQAYEGRGSDPFTNVAAARRRRTKLNNEWRSRTSKFVVQRARVAWESYDG